MTWRGVAQRGVGTIGRSVGIGAAPAILSRRGNRRGEILDPLADLVVSGVVRAERRDRAVGLETIDPAPESVSGIDCHWPVGRARLRPQPGWLSRYPAISRNVYFSPMAGWFFKNSRI